MGEGSREVFHLGQIQAVFQKLMIIIILLIIISITIKILIVGGGKEGGLGSTQANKFWPRLYVLKWPLLSLLPPGTSLET